MNHLLPPIIGPRNNMTKVKRVYKYGQCYKNPKTFVTFSIEEVYTDSKKLLVRNMVTRGVCVIPASLLDEYEQEYTYSE